MGNPIVDVLKLPLLCYGATLFGPATSSPQPPPTPEEIAKYAGVQDPYPRTIARAISSATEITLWLNAAAESAVLLASRFPSETSNQVISILAARAGGPGNVRFTLVWLAGSLLLAGGSAVQLICFDALGKNFVSGIVVRDGHALVTTGPYAIVRHPSYVGSTCMHLGVLLTLFAPGSWIYECIGLDSPWVSILVTFFSMYALFTPVVLFARAGKEEEVLSKEFGQQWEVYTKRTPYKAIPYLY